MFLWVEWAQLGGSLLSLLMLRWWLGLQASEGSSGLDIQDSALTWLAIEVGY